MGCYDRNNDGSSLPTAGTTALPVGVARSVAPSNRLARRGSILILVVGVLVLLAIAATLYIGVGQQERVSAAAQESTAVRGEVITKITEFLGQVLADDLWAIDPQTGQAVRPFEDGIESRADVRAGERTDYPYTRPTPGNDHSSFKVLADPWLASTEAVDRIGNDGIPETWGHWSNVNPNGTFNDLDLLFANYRGLGLYGATTLNASPFEADTPIFNMNKEYHQRFSDYSLQMDDVDNTDGVDGIPTYADQRYGTDTDGDGHIDARWTELVDVYGFPQGMRVFSAFRIVDLSGLVNINTSIETGATRDDDTGDNVGFARYASDIDLYTMLLDEYGRLGGTLERYFAGGDPGGQNGAYRENLSRLGMLGYANEYLENPDSLNYDFYQRLRAADRAKMYQAFLANPQQRFDDFRPYGPEDELELRTYWGMSNDTHTSRLEENFEVLNEDKRDQATWFSPFRSRYPYEIDYSNSEPSTEELMAITGIRNKVTTFNGQRSVSPYNVSEQDTTIRLRPNINDLLRPIDTDTNVDLQAVFGGFAWALMPFAVYHDKDVNGNYEDTDIYGKPAEWSSTVRWNTNYGGRSGNNANFAYLRAAMLAVNTLDYFDRDETDDDPTVRFLRFEQEDLQSGNPRDAETELTGIFAHGQIHDDGVNPDKNLLLIGLEKQPFFREVAQVQLWNGERDMNDPNIWVINPWLDDPPNGEWNHLALEIVAIELGNPWDEDIELSHFEIVVGDKDDAGEIIDLSVLANTTLAAGESVIIERWVRGDSLPGMIGLRLQENWADAIRDNGGALEIRNIEAQKFLIADSLVESEQEVTLWRKNVNFRTGSDIPRLLVDRIAANQVGTTGEDFFPGRLESGGLPYEDLSGGANPGLQILFNSSIRRNVARPDGNAPSFPPYVLQSPESIGTNGVFTKQFRVEGAGIYPAFTFFSDADNAGELIDQLNTVDAADKGYPAGFADTFYTRFQMHVLNGEDIASPFDLLNVPAISHVFIPNDGTNFDPLTEPAQLDYATRVRYVTISEMLGDESLTQTFERRLPAKVPVLLDLIQPMGNVAGNWPPDSRVLPGGVPNYFVGRLDYTRYIPAQNSTSLIPQAVPLAARVVDAFDTITPLTPSGLVQGRININTAPLRVLQALPFLNPRYKAGEIPARTPSVRFAKSVEAYRDRWQLLAPVGMNWSNRAEASQLIESNGTHGLRQDAVRESGFTSLGELALISRWAPVGSTGVEISHEPDWSNPVLNNQMLTQVGHGGGASNFDYAPLNPNARATEKTPDYDPADDVTEWLIMPRNISNVISLRSDIFCAYIKVIGFTQADLDDAMQKEDDGTVDKALDALQPTMAQRYVVVFDRSNVKNPGDRPRLLFAIQEVPTR